MKKCLLLILSGITTLSITSCFPINSNSQHPADHYGNLGYRKVIIQGSVYYIKNGNYYQYRNGRYNSVNNPYITTEPTTPDYDSPTPPVYTPELPKPVIKPKPKPTNIPFKPLPYTPPSIDL